MLEAGIPDVTNVSVSTATAIVTVQPVGKPAFMAHRSRENDSISSGRLRAECHVSTTHPVTSRRLYPLRQNPNDWRAGLLRPRPYRLVRDFAFQDCGAIVRYLGRHLLFLPFKVKQRCGPRRWPRHLSNGCLLPLDWL